MKTNESLDTLVENVQANSKYQHIYRGLVERLAQEAIKKGMKGKAAVKSIRSKLHQVGGAYFRKPINFEQSKTMLNMLPNDLHSEPVRSFCAQQMKFHASTSERLPILEEFFSTCFASIAPITSIADLACGLNPLALPWMPLAPGFRYWACDIYLDMMDFLQAYFDHFNIDGEASPCDLLGGPNTQEAQVAILLKSIPCLEQVDKSIGEQLLDKIQAQHILISFPVSSLGGQRKGMPAFYRDHFYSLIADKSWKVQEFVFSSELAFLVTK